TSGSSLTVNHSGNNNYLNFTAGADTIGNLSISSGVSGSAGIGTDLTVTGMLNLGSGTFNIDQRNLTLNGTLDSTGSGTISGGSNGTANLTIGGNASNFGKLMFTPDSSVINNLTVNNNNAGWVYLGTSLTVNQSLTLDGGRIGLLDTSDIIIIGTDTIHGGSANSYVATMGTGSLYINIPDSTSLNGYDDAMLHIGTQANYAPVRIHNNGSAVGTFGANARPGVFANGTTGADLSATESIVNTSWNLRSNLDSNLNASIEAFWSAGMEVNQFNRNDVQLKHYTGAGWDSITGTQANLNANGMASVRRNNVTSFSPFAVFSKPIATGIIEPTAKAQIFSLFPNPATTQTNIALTNADKNYELRITDIAGKQVAFYNVNDTNNIIDVNNFAPGIYFFTLNNLHTQRFVKQ
ncbi:MAG: T9SS type A sorting domain-containing protein, partial [Chitinophagales bacterium]|nr:T9SS type A sorting domain-containing protein [Chitinophagales bacterium]